jgi:hypothetical protein
LHFLFEQLFGAARDDEVVRPSNQIHCGSAALGYFSLSFCSRPSRVRLAKTGETTLFLYTLGRRSYNLALFIPRVPKYWIMLFKRMKGVTKKEMISHQPNTSVVPVKD